MRLLAAAVLAAAPSLAWALAGGEPQAQFRPPREDEVELRALVAAFAAAWNAGDGAALSRLALTPADTRAIPPGDLPRLDEQLRSEQSAGPWRIELEPDRLRVGIVKPGQVRLHQPYRRLAEGAAAGADVLEATAVKGSRGWRLLEVRPRTAGLLKAHEATGQIPEPRRTKDVPPVYPEAAKKARLEGVVTLECRITPEGKVADVKVLHGAPELNDAAIEAVRQWEYEPTILNGKPVSVTMTVRVAFRLGV
jgi:TonB family protein